MSAANEKGNGSFPDLTGLRLQVFVYLLKVGKEVGPTEVRHGLGLKTASHASYHLTKLVEEGYVKKNPNNTYTLKPEYNVRSMRLNAMVDYFLINGTLWPKQSFYATFLTCTLILDIVLIGLGKTFVVAVFSILSLLVVLPYQIKDIIQLKISNE
ncbi:MAG: hypothetical protein D6732_18650 [Methanobacteriota archaeon]|nr:MAG: hypothetical protein D6732_18650 [Euryarchaeota archaeon]